MEDSPAVQLIAVEIQNPEFATLLNDIRDFDWKVVNRLRKEDLARIQTTGFQFKSKGQENQKQEFKSFMFEHPSCMASDLETIIYKLNVFSRLITRAPTQATQEHVRIEPTRTAITHQRTQKKTRKPKRKVVIIEEEEEEESYTDEEEEYVPVSYKRSKKPR